MKPTDQFLQDFTNFETQKDKLDEEVCKLENRKYTDFYNRFNPKQLKQYRKFRSKLNEYSTGLSPYFIMAMLCLIISNVILLDMPNKDIYNLWVIIAIEIAGILSLTKYIVSKINYRKLKKRIKVLNTKKG